MIKQVFSVYDSKVKFYDSPFLARNKGEAIRGFADAANKKETYVGSHPEDYTLFFIAEYDDESGVYRPVSHESCGVALEYVNSVVVKDKVVELKK